MNVSGSLPNHKNRLKYTMETASGLLRGTAGRIFFELFVTDPPARATLREQRQSSYMEDREKQVEIAVEYNLQMNRLA
jgi:hypothetical protein